MFSRKTNEQGSGPILSSTAEPHIGIENAPFEEPEIHPVEEPHYLGSDTDLRRPNFPPCRPCFHHSIATDIDYPYQIFVRKALLGWIIHCCTLVWNFVCMLGAIVLKQALGGFFLAGLLLVAGSILSFILYMMFYTAMRKQSSFWMVLWFVCFCIHIGLEIFCGLGFESTGGAGLLDMIELFNSQVVLAIMELISTIFWTIIVVYNIIFLIQARKLYSSFGGSQAATQEFGKASLSVAYQNKDTIIQVAKDNKDTIIEFAKENKETIVQVAKDNKETIAKVAYQNKDAVWENQHVVNNVFS